MTAMSTTCKRALDKQDIMPLIDLCKAGRLFDVQQWIASGKPVNPPPIPAKGARILSPLEIAIDRGFHSLVQVLLAGGAIQEPDGFHSPMSRALRARRLDIVQLLVEHGFDATTIDLTEALETWDPRIMEYFLERGADVHKGDPFADAFCRRIRTALRPFKQWRERVPEIQEQANIALRHHCKEGNLKWVSLMLWLGADPCKPGVLEPGQEPESDEDALSALGYAAVYDHYEVFELKPVRSKLAAATDAIPYLTHGKGVDVLKAILENGANPNDADGSCRAIGMCLSTMGWSGSGRGWNGEITASKHDSTYCRDHLRAIHLLVKHRAKWQPREKHQINDARKSLLRLIPDYTLEFVWIMSKYQGCSLETIQSLLSTPTIKSHTSGHRTRLAELLGGWDRPALG